MRFLMIVFGVLCALAWLGAASAMPETAEFAAEDLPDDFSDAFRFKRSPGGELDPEKLKELFG